MKVAKGNRVQESGFRSKRELPEPRTLNPVSWLALLCAFALFFLTPLVFADAPSLTVKASRDSVYLGESFLVEVRVDDPDASIKPDLSAIRNGAAELLGNQPLNYQSMVSVNGQVRREGFNGRVFTYKLTPATEGVVTLGPVTALVKGALITGTGPTVTVTGVTQQDLVIASVTASRTTLMVDEPFEIQVKLRIKSLPSPYQVTEPLYPSDPPHIEAEFLNGQEIDGLKSPDFQKLLSEHLTPMNQPGFTLNGFTAPASPFDFGPMFNMQGSPARFKLDRRKGVQDKQNYWEYSLTIPYSPLTEGAYTFGPLLFKGTVPTEVKADGTVNGRPIFAVGPAAMVRVIPPPEENRPDSYIGAIGSNLTVEASLDAQTCNVGDPLKLTLTLSGSVQMRNITPPKLTLQPALAERFEIYDDSVQAIKLNDQRQYVYTLRPRQAGSFELPPVEVSYYDVVSRQYRTARSLSIPLKVRQAAEITAAQIIGGSTNAGPRLHREMELAMRPAGIRMGSSGAQSVTLIGNPMSLAFYAGLGPAVFGICLFGLWVRQKRPAFKQAQRQRQGFSRASQAIRKLNDKEAADSHRAICMILRHYLGDRFGVQADALTPCEAESILVKRGIPYDLAKRFSGMMQHHFDVAFGTSQAPVDIQALLTMLASIENYRHDTPRSRLTRKALLVAFMWLSVGVAGASTLAERSFIWMESLTELSSAQSPKDFLAAAGTCQKLVDLGVRNPDLFYNQGTALLLAERPAEAVAVLLRAERYGGRAADVSRNMAIAEGRKQGLKTPMSSWLRAVLFWHYELDCATRASIAALAFSLIWIAATMGLFGMKRLGKTLMIIAAILFVLFGSSVLTSLQQESQVARPTSLQ